MDKSTWNHIIQSLPRPHLLQTYEWGAVKSQYGWQPHYKTWEDNAGKTIAAALVLERTLPIRGLAAKVRMLYTPKGPLLANWNDDTLRQRVLADLKAFAQQRGAFVIKIDPDVRLGTGIPGEEDAQENATGHTFVEELKTNGWHFSNEQIQFKHTVYIDLTESEDDMLQRMKSKTRYNVRLAGRRGVSVRLGTPADFEMLAHMYAETALRDGFTIRGLDYYHTVWSTFYDSGMLKPLIAEVEGEPVAGLMLFTFGPTGWYIYGMSTEKHRKIMPTYLLQWEAMLQSKAAGCARYDMWGAPDVFNESDSMWGVYRFKDGFGGEVVRHIGAWDLPVKPWLYNLYTRVLPRILDVMRRRGQAETQQAAGMD